MYRCPACGNGDDDVGYLYYDNDFNDWNLGSSGCGSTAVGLYIASSATSPLDISGTWYHSSPTGSGFDALSDPIVIECFTPSGGYLPLGTSLIQTLFSLCMMVCVQWWNAMWLVQPHGSQRRWCAHICVCDWSHLLMHVGGAVYKWAYGLYNDPCRVKMPVCAFTRFLMHVRFLDGGSPCLN